MTSERQQHWERVYEQKDAQKVSWYRAHLDVSLDLLRQAGLGANSRVIDVGAGASTLVDDLLDLGVTDIVALDLSSASLDVARRRLGDRGASVTWLVADVTSVELREGSIDLWHDRAALHFLTDDTSVRAYARVAAAAVAPGGFAIIGGFASDGPTQCSGLDVTRRDGNDVARIFAPDFTLIEERRELHATPAGSPQSFAYALLRREAAPHRR